MIRAKRQWMRAGVSAAMSLLVIVAAGCGADDASDRAAVTIPRAAEARDFSEPGEFAVGVTRLSLGQDRPVVVFYPIDRERPTAEGRRFVYTPDDVWGPMAQALPPDLLSDWEVPGTRVDAPGSAAGPFPVVVFSHGRGTTPFSHSFHYAHLASWGYVVAAPRHASRDLQARLAGRDTGASDVAAVGEVIDLLATQHALPGGVLEGRLALDDLAVEGHSAGGRTAALSATEYGAAVWIALAPSPPVPDEATDGHDIDLDGNFGFDPAAGEFDLERFLSDAEPPPGPSLMIVADHDVIFPVSDRRMVFDWLRSAKRFVVLADTGHYVFADACKWTQDNGGVGAFADALGLDRSSMEIQLVEDGCLGADAPVADVVAVWNHLAVAQLRLAFDTDPEVAAASLQHEYLDATFPGRLADYVVDDTTP